MVNTRFWDDDYTSNLDPIEKLLFLYFLTNTSTNICGVYEIPLKKIANETGIDKEMVLKIINRFSKDFKIFYKDGWAVVRNFIKHQNQKSPKVQKGIEIELENAPEHIKELLKLKGIDTLSHSNTNTNSNTNSNINLTKLNTGDKELLQDISLIIKEFESVNPICKNFYRNKTQRNNCKDLIELYGLEQVLKVIKILPKTNKLEFVPVVTTPAQLNSKWTQLATALQKLKNKQPIIL
jgi:hypothetical protein